MKPPPRPTDEARRLATLREYHWLDTLPERAFDELTALVAHVCETPIALITLVDEHRQWFKSKFGLAVCETHRDISFCGHAILQSELFIVPDAAQDARFADNPLVTGDPKIRFYAGAPLITKEGFCLGTLSVIDRVPRTLTPTQQEILWVLSRQVMAQLELRRQTQELVASGARLREREEQLRLYAQHSPAAVAMFDRDMKYLVASQRWMENNGLVDQSFVGRSHYEVVPDIPLRWREVHQRCLAGASEQCDAEPFVRADGRTDWIRWEVRPWHQADGAIGGIILFYEDITVQKQAEQHILRLNRTLSMLSDINQTIVREPDPQAMLAAACRIAVERGQFQMAWIGMLNPETPLLQPVASSGVVEGYLERMTVNLQDGAQNTELSARCINTGTHAICNDIAHDPLYLPWRDEALRCGYRSSAAFPLKLAGEAVGVFCLYAAEPGFFSEEELRLLDELAMDISFALEVSRRETHRVRVEQALRESEERWKFAIEGAGDGVWDLRVPTREVRFSKRWKEMLGYAESEIADRFESWTELVHPDDLPGALAAVQAYLDGQTPAYINEHRLRGKDGQYQWILVRGVAVSRDAAGRPLRMVGTHTDITERKRAEEELRWRTAFFEAQIDSAPDGILVVDVQGKRILQNQRMNELWKIPPLVAESKTVSTQTEFVTRQTKNPRQFIERVTYLNAHPDETSQDVIELVDGTILDRTSSPVRDKAGKHYGRIWTFRDITQQRQLEEQLRQSQKMEAIGQLAGGVAHDFNNILAAIMMQAELVATGPNLSADTQEAITDIKVSTERAANLTRQLLAFSRRQVMQTRQVDLNEIVTSLAKMLRRILGEDVHLQLKLHPHALLTRADTGMLGQVLLNLVVNARDAMPEGGELILETAEKIFTPAEVVVRPDLTAGRYACLRVTDTGCGMAPEIRARIFEPFFTTKEPGKGTGLGLATVFGIIKQHGGAVAVESQVGQGTTFLVWLPSTQATATDKAEAVAASKPRGGTETILLVEDEPAVRRLTRVLLTRAGYTVLEAENGVEALRLWEQHQHTIQLVFTDLVMPEGISGRELATRLLARQPKLRVIFTSGYSADIAGRELILQEGQNFLQKPSTPGQLLDIVRQCLDA